jgi:hypothetical protein
MDSANHWLSAARSWAGMAASSCAGLDRLGHATVHQIQQIADIHRHQHIGRRALAFGLDAQQAVLDDTVFADLGLRREGSQQGWIRAGSRVV